MSAITIDGDLVHYEVLGRGRPVILLHGLLGSWRYWIPTIQHLQQNFRVYALDLYGFGDSAKKPEKYALRHQVALVADFMQEMGLPKAALIGHDLGAYVAVEFAQQYPDRVARLMIVNTPLYNPGDLEQRVPLRRVSIESRPAGAESQPLDPSSAPTLMSPGAAMRKALMEAAAARSRQTPAAVPVAVPPPAEVTIPRRPTVETSGMNPLKDVVALGSEVLLGRSFKKGEPNYEKLMVDIARGDARAVTDLAATYDAELMLDTIRLLPMPIALVHGLEDSVTPPPAEAVLNYLTGERGSTVVPILLPGTRHFPMLEDPRFDVLIKECLEAVDFSRIAVKDRWVRRTR